MLYASSSHVEHVYVSGLWEHCLEWRCTDGFCGERHRVCFRTYTWCARVETPPLHAWQQRAQRPRAGSSLVEVVECTLVYNDCDMQKLRARVDASSFWPRDRLAINGRTSSRWSSPESEKGHPHRLAKRAQPVPAVPRLAASGLSSKKIERTSWFLAEATCPTYQIAAFQWMHCLWRSSPKSNVRCRIEDTYSILYQLPSPTARKTAAASAFRAHARSTIVNCHESSIVTVEVIAVYGILETV